MNAADRPTRADIAYSSLWGIARGVSVHTLIYPLDVVKIRQQCHPHAEKSYRIALNIIQKEGATALYRGLPHQVLKTALKGAWSWPMITGAPAMLNRWGVEGLHQQALTGLAIGTIDAAVTTPLERSRIVSAFSGRGNFSFKGIYKDGWQGFSAHWAKQSVSWSAFLTAQKILRDRYQNKQEDPLTLPQLTGIGMQVAFIVSTVSAPLDVINNLKQARNVSPSHYFSGRALRGLYRGWPLSALSLVVHNIASLIVIDKLAQHQAAVSNSSSS